MNDYERLINNSKYLLDDFGKYSLEAWFDLFVQEAIDSGLPITVDNRPSGGLVVVLALLHLKDPDRVFAKQDGRYITLCIGDNGDKKDYEVLCTFELRSESRPKLSIIEDLRALGAPSGLFNEAKQMILNMNVFQKMPG